MGKALRLSEELFLTREDAEKYIENVVKMREQFKDRVLTDPSSFEEEKTELHWSGRCSSMKYDSERTLFLFLARAETARHEFIYLPERIKIKR